MKKNLFNLDPLTVFSHELKTPLNSLDLSLSLLERDFDKNKDLIPLMHAEISFLKELIQDNLDLRLIQGKKDILSPEWFNFNTLLKNQCSSLKTLAEQNRLSFFVKKPSQIEVFADTFWMSCVLRNLLFNALNSSVEGSLVEIEFGFNKDQKFFCSIANQSSAPLDVKKVFDLFYSKISNQNMKGTGIGLSLVQAVIQKHKGEIKAQKTKGKVVFSFILPKSQEIKKSA